MTKLAKKVIFAFAGAILLFVVIAIGVAWYVLHSFDQAFNAGQYPHKSDAEMTQNFNEHRQEFELVRTMLDGDSDISRIDEDWTIPPNLDPAKVAAYRNLFGVIGTPRGVNRRPGSSDIDLIATSLGWVASGSMKGYAYVSKKPSDGYFADSLDDPKKLPNLARYYRRLDGNWYLYFER